MEIGGNHLTYCSNIHPGESWEDHFMQLKLHFPGIREALAGNSPMALGLRIANNASCTLDEEKHLEEFRHWLHQHQAYVFAINGFPYGSFHGSAVKDQVHTPDWTTPERRDYTMRLARILSRLPQNGQDGGISTSPLSYRRWHTPSDRPQVVAKATAHMVEVLLYLISLREDTGKVIHLDIEPEPDGVLETGEEFIQWYEQELTQQALPAIQGALGISTADAGGILREHIRLCYDVCHFAVGYEPHAYCMEQLSAKQIRIGRVQLSAALKVSLGEAPERNRIAEALAAYNEPVYLHQVVAQTRAGGLVRYPDLSEALRDVQNVQVSEWRAHYHVPVFMDDFGLLQSTQADIKTVLDLIKKQDLCRHLEVETYTWDVLPASYKLPVGQSIIRELSWVRQQLAN